MKIICPKMIDSLLAQMIIKCQILLSFSRSKINVLNLGTEPVCLPIIGLFRYPIIIGLFRYPILIGLFRYPILIGLFRYPIIVVCFVSWYSSAVVNADNLIGIFERHDSCYVEPVETRYWTLSSKMLNSERNINRVNYVLWRGKHLKVSFGFLINLV